MKARMQRLYQTIDVSLNIKLIFPSLLLLFSFKPGDVTTILKLPVLKKQLKVERAFQGVRIEGDILLVLNNDPAGRVIMEGTEKELNKIRPAFENNILIIDAKRKLLSAKLTIYLSATTLHSIQFNGDGKISSFDFINPDHLRISLNGNIKVNVKTMGQVAFDTPDDIELRMKLPVMGK